MTNSNAKKIIYTCIKEHEDTHHNLMYGKIQIGECNPVTKRVGFTDKDPKGALGEYREYLAEIKCYSRLKESNACNASPECEWIVDKMREFAEEMLEKIKKDLGMN